MVALAEKYTRESYTPRNRTAENSRSPQNAYPDFFLQPKNRGPATNNRILSAKYLDDSLEWYYYGLRYYSPELGRWPSRDPIGEWGGENLYEFADNNGVSSVDILGLIPGCSRQKTDDSCCCCCVEDLDVVTKLKYRRFKPAKRFIGPRVGTYHYAIWFKPKLSYTKVAGGGSCADTQCRLRVIERNYSDSTMNMAVPGGSLAPGETSIPFRTWRGWKPKTNCPKNPVLMSMYSPHGFRRISRPQTDTSHLKTDVTIFSGSSPKCKSVCRLGSKRVSVETKLKLINGVPDPTYQDINVNKS